MYDNLYNRLRAHNMFLHPYQDINPVDGVEILNNNNCVNFVNARRVMSENIYLFFNTYKAKIFPDLPSLQAELVQFRQGAKGIEFLNHLMKKRHPKLTRLQRTSNLLTLDNKPTFSSCKDIYQFIAKYRTWFQDEVLLQRGNRTDMEHLKYIFGELGDTFKDAWTEINKKIPARRTKFHSENDDGYDIPVEFTLISVELASNIMNELIPFNISYEDTINDVSDTNHQLHALRRAPTKPSIKDKPRFSSNKSYDRGEKRQTSTRPSSTLPPRDSIDSTCRACGKARHEIFTTGCDQFALYCKCKAMDSKITAKQREKTIKNFEERQSQILLAKKRSKKSIRKLISAMSDQNPSEVIDELKEELGVQFNETYPDDTTEDIFQESDSDQESASS